MALPIAVGALTCFLAACGRQAGALDVATNPHSTQIYKIDASIDGAPASFDDLKADATYEVENTSCVPSAPVSVVHKTPRHVVNLPIATTGNVHSVLVAADALMDDNYFGRGVCHWTLTSVGFTATTGHRSFVAAISPVGTYAKDSVTTYFSAKAFADSSDPIIDTGLYDRSRFKDPEDTFEMHLTARKAN